MANFGQRRYFGRSQQYLGYLVKFYQWGHHSETAKFKQKAGNEDGNGDCRKNVKEAGVRFRLSNPPGTGDW